MILISDSISEIIWRYTTGVMSPMLIEIYAGE